MFERFTRAARRTVLDGVATAQELGADKVGPPHLLMAIAAADGTGARVLAGYGVTAAGLRAAATGAGRRAGLSDSEVAALRSVGIDADEVFRRIEEAFGPDALAEDPPDPAPRRLGRLGSPFDQAAKKALELSLREAIQLRHREIGSEHILLGVLRTGVTGPIGEELSARGVTYEDVRRRVVAEVSGAA